MKVLLFSLILSFNLLSIHYIVGQKVIKIYNQEEQGLSYVNVSLKNKPIGAHSNEFGEVAINDQFINDTIIFSKAGYRDTTVIFGSNLESVIMEKAMIHKESFPSSVSGKRVVRIGKVNVEKYGSLSNSGRPEVYLNYFPSRNSHGYYLDHLKFRTESEIKEAKVLIRIYSATEEFEPKDYLHCKDIEVDIKIGERVNKIDLSDLGLKMPKNGLFIGLETLIIPENIHTYSERNLMTEEVSQRAEYMPSYKLFESENKTKEKYPTYIFVNGSFSKVEDLLTMAVQLKLKRP